MEDTSVMMEGLEKSSPDQIEGLFALAMAGVSMCNLLREAADFRNI